MPHEKLYNALKAALTNINQEKKISLDFDLIDNSPYISLGEHLIIVFYDNEIWIETFLYDEIQTREIFSLDQLTDAALVILQSFLNKEVLLLAEQELST